MFRPLLSIIALCVTLPVCAAGLEVQSLGDGLYALVGETDQRTPENLGNNATYGLIVTDEGAVLIDSGAGWKAAEQVHAAIRTVTDRPVRWVINSGGQDHRWLGNDYWRRQGAGIIAAEAAVADQKARLSAQWERLLRSVGEAGLAGTEPVYTDDTFAERKDLEIGGVHLIIRHVATAHTAGDSFVWLPEQRVLFAGDIVFLERMLRVAPHSSITGWLESFAALEELDPKTVVPGHGHAAPFAEARRQTGDYLQALYDRVGAFLDEGGALEDISQVDQSEFMDIKLSGQLAGGNAHQVYQQLEFAE